MLHLTALDYEGPTRWRWRLTDDSGAFIADHEVRLDASEQEFEAFTDIYAFLRRHVALDRWLESEAELVDDVGRWIARNVLGAIGPALTARAPVTVKVSLNEAPLLAHRPLELAVVGDGPLALHEVSLVFTGTEPSDPHPKVPIGKRLRMLGVFSLPVDASALNLRRERVALSRLVHDIEATSGRAIDLRVAQYGVTRDRLERIILEDEGWDVVHISGHGLPAGLLLENEDGTRDQIAGHELAAILKPTRARLKLVVLSACESAALTAAQHLQMLGLTDSAAADADAARTLRTSDALDAEADRDQLPSLATTLSDQLDCAVIAMRFPVTDSFAIDLAQRLYDHLLDKNRPVTEALALALPRVVHTPPTPAAPALSAGTPSVFGRRAIDLRLPAPAGPPVRFDADAEKLASFPPQPLRFVGRVSALSTSTAAFATRSNATGVMFHGMAGAGKTACALELAYTHEASFRRMAWWQAPAQEEDIGSSLSTLAFDLETQIPGLELVSFVDQQAELERLLPKVRSFLARHRILIVLDNLESLLTTRGEWRDTRWKLLIDALGGHGGASRLVLTSRILPRSLPDGMVVEAVHALPATEAILLAREQPHLGKLLVGALEGFGPAESRQLATHILSTAQGHPKLLELADAQLSRPAALHARLDAADASWSTAGVELSAFLRDGESAAEDDDYLSVLKQWALGIREDLGAGAKLLFDVLSCTETEDRNTLVLGPNWEDIWDAVGAPGDVPDLSALVAELEQQALVDVQVMSKTLTTFDLHPAIAEAGRQTVSRHVAEAVDLELAAWWERQFRYGVENQDEQLGTWILFTARRGAPYLMRTEAWGSLTASIELALTRDHSLPVASAFLSIAQQAEERTRGTRFWKGWERIVVLCLQLLRPAEGIKRTEQLLTLAEQEPDHLLSIVLLGDLIRVRHASGDLAAVQALIARRREHESALEVSPWETATTELVELQTRVIDGSHQEVWEATSDLRRRVAEFEEPPPELDETARMVREGLLSLMMLAANHLGKYDEALEVAADLFALLDRRGASQLERADHEINTYSTLIALGRTPEARELLDRLRGVYENARAVPQLAIIYAAQADLALNLGHIDSALRFGRDALRLSYASGDFEHTYKAHLNLSSVLMRSGVSGAEGVAQRCAGGLLARAAGLPLEALEQEIARDMALCEATAPESWADLCAIVEQSPGVRFEASCLRFASADTFEASFARLRQEAFRQMSSDGVQYAAERARVWRLLASASVRYRHTGDVHADLVASALNTSLAFEHGRPVAAAIASLRSGRPVDHATFVELDALDEMLLRRFKAALEGAQAVDPEAWESLIADPVNDARIRSHVTFLAVETAARPELNEATTPLLTEYTQIARWEPLMSAVLAIVGGVREITEQPLDPEDREAVDALLDALQPD